MSDLAHYVQEQKSKYSSKQPELMWPVLLAMVIGVFMALLPIIVAQNRVAADFHYDPLLGSPTLGRFYLNPSTYFAWKSHCRTPGTRLSQDMLRFPACNEDGPRKVVLTALSRYDHQVFLSSTGLFALTVMLGFQIRHRRQSKARVRTHGDAKWATFDELVKANLILSKRKHLATDKGKIGFPLGVITQRRRRYYVYTNPQEALGIMLVGPPGSGKTSCFYIPHLLTDASSKFVYDPSLEMWRKTSGWRSTPREEGGAGNITLLFAPSQPEISCHINPLDSIKWETPKEIATLQNFWKRLLDFADKAGEGPEAHWIATGSVLAECTALHLHYTEAWNCTGEGVYNYLARFEDSDDGNTSGADVALYEMMNTPHDPEFRQGWVDDEGNPTPVHPYVVRSARETLQKAPNEKSGVISTTRRFLHFFRDPQVAQVTRDSSLSLDDLMLNKRPISLYFGIAPRDAQRLRPLVGLLVNLVTFEHMGDDALNLDTGKFRWVHPLDLDIDEAAQLKKQEQLFMNFSMARKYGIGPNLGYQDISQVWAAAGGQHEEAVTSISNYKIILRPNKPETAKWLSEEVLGKTTGQDFIRNFSGNRLGYLGNAMTQQNFMPTPLMSPQALMDMPPHIAVVKAGDVSPFIVETLYYESDPVLKARSEIAPPKKSMEIPLEERAYRPSWLTRLRRRPKNASGGFVNPQGSTATGSLTQMRSPLQQVERDAGQDTEVAEGLDESAKTQSEQGQQTSKQTNQRQALFDKKSALDHFMDM